MEGRSTLHWNNTESTMLELFQHILDLDFEWLFATYDTYVYFILFMIIFIETGLVIMPFLPGDSLLFTAGLFARSGYLDMAALTLLLFVAAVLGDNTNYFIGKHIGLRALKWKIKGRQLVKQEHIDTTHAFYEKYGPKTIIMARFVPIVRTFAPFVAGIAEMSPMKFFTFNVVGGAVWVFGLTFAGYFLGEFDMIRNNIGKVALLIVGLSVLPMVFEFVKYKLEQQKK